MLHRLSPSPRRGVTISKLKRHAYDPVASFTYVLLFYSLLPRNSTQLFAAKEGVSDDLAVRIQAMEGAHLVRVVAAH